MPTIIYKKESGSNVGKLIFSLIFLALIFIFGIKKKDEIKKVVKKMQEKMRERNDVFVSDGLTRKEKSFFSDTFSKKKCCLTACFPKEKGCFTESFLKKFHFKKDEQEVNK